MQRPTIGLICIQTGKTVADSNRLKFNSGVYLLKSPDEMKTFFKEVPEAVLNSRTIAERCNVDFTTGKSFLPTYRLKAVSHLIPFLKNLQEKACTRNLEASRS